MLGWAERWQSVDRVSAERWRTVGRVAAGRWWQNVLRSPVRPKLVRQCVAVRHSVDNFVLRAQKLVQAMLLEELR